MLVRSFDAEEIPPRPDLFPERLERVDIVDAFVHDDGGTPMRAITFSLRYGNREGDRSAEAVNVASSGLIDAVLANYGDRGVTLRA